MFQIEEQGDRDPRDSRDPRRRDRRDSRSDMFPKPRYYQKDEDRLRDERNESEDQLKKLELVVLQHQEANSRLQAKLDEEKARALRSADHMQSVIDNREYFLREQSSDEDICRKFLDLMNKIKNCPGGRWPSAKATQEL